VPTIDTDIPPERTRPSARNSAGWSLRVAVLGAASPLGEGDALREVIEAAGATVRELRSRGDVARRFEVLCSSDAHQQRVRAAVSTIDTAGHVTIEDCTFALHRGGKVAVTPVAEVRNPAELAMAYTPGVGRVASAIAADPSEVWRSTGRGNSVAIVTNGSAALGLGNVGPEAALPVMEGKAVLFKQFAGVDAYPICLDAPTADEIVAAVAAIAPGFGGINLEDIASPICFEVEERLQERLQIPVFHDDQHGTAIAVLAALRNAARAVGKRFEDLSVAVVGAGAAGLACAKLIHRVGVADIVGVDRPGLLHAGLTEPLGPSQRWFVEHGNKDQRSGGVREALKGADVLIGLSCRGVVEPAWLEDMADDAIVFVLANPEPEVMPEHIPANVAVVATGRSDYPNQINNVLAFPGVFRGLLDARATRVTESMKLAAADALASMVVAPTRDRILPSVFDPGVADRVAAAVRKVAFEEGHVRP
jgi:malate dehydrogenase (oxaloacetate-decarboxylating)